MKTFLEISGAVAWVVGIGGLIAAYVATWNDRESDSRDRIIRNKYVA